MRRFTLLCLGILVAGLVVARPASGQKKAKIADLLKELETTNTPGVRTNALKEIGELADVKLVWAKMALPQVRDMLAKDPDSKIRGAALGCLGKIEADVKDYVPNMLKYLKEDKDYGVQNTALALLAQYQQDAAPAIKPLQERMEELRELNKDQDPGNVRSGILNTLPQINQGLGQPTSIEALEKDKAISVRLTAIGRLTQIGQQGGAKDTGPILVKAYAESLKAGPSADLRRGILGALAVIEPNPKNYLPLLLETLQKDSDAGTVVAVIAALARGGDAAKDAIPAVLEAQKKAMAAAPKDGSDPNGQRRSIVESVARLGVEPKVLVPVLVDVVRKDRDAGVRTAALAGLSGLGAQAKDGVPAIAAMAKGNAVVGAKDGNDPGDLRRVTLETLAKMGPDPKDLVAILTDTIRRDRNPAVRTTAVRLLGEVGPPAKSALLVLGQLQKLPRTPNDQDRALAKAAADAVAKIQAK